MHDNVARFGRDPDKVVIIGLPIQTELGVHNIAEMRQVPADRILAIQAESQLGLAVDGISIKGPIIDGRVAEPVS